MVLAAAVSAFVVAAVPALIFMAIWTVVTALRLLRPERSLPVMRNGVVERRAAGARGEALGVGFREIREDLKARQRAQTQEKTGAPDPVGEKAGRIPEAWLEDLYRRRN